MSIRVSAVGIERKLKYNKRLWAGGIAKIGRPEAVAKGGFFPRREKAAEGDLDPPIKI